MKLLLSLCIFVCLFSSALRAQEVKSNPLNGVAENLLDIEKNVKGAGVIKTDCADCAKEVSVDRKIELKSEKLDINPVYYSYNRSEFVIVAKRTSQTPKKLTLLFKNGHTVCGKMFVGSNPFISGGPLVVDCLLKYTEFEDNDLDLDFSKLPPLKEGQEQLIEIKLVKKNKDKSDYLVEVTGLDGENFKVKKSKMFWKEGFNLNFYPQEKIEVKEGAP